MIRFVERFSWRVSKCWSTEIFRERVLLGFRRIDLNERKTSNPDASCHSLIYVALLLSVNLLPSTPLPLATYLCEKD